LNKTILHHPCVRLESHHIVRRSGDIVNIPSINSTYCKKCKCKTSFQRGISTREAL